MSMLSRKFRRFLKQGKFKCFNCNKTGHMKKDCPLLKNKGKFKSKKFRKKKDCQASWENSDSSSSDEEEATETANVCFMAQEDELSKYVELLDVFNELYDDFKNEKVKNKVLIKENERLNNENSIYVSQTSSSNSQKDDFEKVISSLKKDNENLLKENSMLKKETISLNSRITILDKKK